METHNNMLCKIPMEKQKVLVYLGCPTDWVPTVVDNWTNIISHQWRCHRVMLCILWHCSPDSAQHVDGRHCVCLKIIWVWKWSVHPKKLGISYHIIYLTLVGGWAYPSEKYDFVSWDDEMESHKIPWFQTTNQIIYIYLITSYGPRSIFGI